jgi:2'-5' RNA ligase
VNRRNPGSSFASAEIVVLRTFISVKIAPTTDLRRLHTRLLNLGDRFRPVALDTLHITLKFLGDTNDAQVPEICAIIRRIAEDAQVMHVRLLGLGAFPNPRRPSVLWVGLDQAEALCRLAAELDCAVASLGFAAESRAFQPHLTLLRIKSRPPDEVFTLLSDDAHTEFGLVAIDEVEYLQSELGPRGSRYTKLATFALNTVERGNQPKG